MLAPKNSCRESTAKPRAAPRGYNPRSTRGVRTRYKLSRPSTRQFRAGLESLWRSAGRFNGGPRGGFAPILSLIQNSAPYATRWALDRTSPRGEFMNLHEYQ